MIDTREWIVLRDPFVRAIGFCPCGAALNVGLGSKEIKMAKLTPLQEIKERFGSKDKLVKELKALFDKGELFAERLNPEKGIAHVANRKLLRLYDVANEIKERFSTRAKLTDDLLKMLKREKDTGLKERFDKWGLPRLWDHYKSVAKKKD
jgi:hypothetical protein